MDIKSNDPYLMSIRNVDKLNQENSLVNIYPVLIDRSLNTHYGKTIRSFVSLSMISQIKINNVLSITQFATSVEKDKTSNNTIKKLQTNLGYIPAETDTIDLEKEKYQSQRLEISRYEYQEKINNFLHFIKNQIQYDPAYAEFQPFISSITAQNLIQIPLIIGTMGIQGDTMSYYWILFIAIATSTKLRKVSDLDKIFKFTQMLPAENYLDLFAIKDDFKFPSFINQTNPNQTKGEKIVEQTFTQMHAAYYQLRNVLNEGLWNKEVGFGSMSGIQVNTAFEQSIGIRKKLIMKSKGLFTNFVANELVRIMQSLAYTLVGSTDVDLTRKISEFNDDLFDMIDGLDIFDVILGALGSGLQSAENIEQGDEIIKFIKSSCEQNSEMGVLKILQDVKKISFSLVPSSDIGKDLIEFISALNEPVSKLDIFSKNIESKMKSVSEYGDNNLRNSLIGILRGNNNSVYKDIYKMVTKFYKGLDGLVDIEGPEFDAGVDPGVGPVGFNTKKTKTKIDLAYLKKTFPSFFTDNSTTEELFKKYATIVGKDSIKLKSKRFDFLTGSSGNLDNYLLNSIGAITQLIYFNLLYISYSYFCEYIGEIEIELEVQKKNALSFPNYTLVIPDVFVKGIYMAMATRSYKELLEKGSSSYGNTVRVNEKNLINMTNVISERLGVPNVIVVDRKKKELIYKFSYMKGKPLKIGLSSIESYVKHQSDVIGGF